MLALNLAQAVALAMTVISATAAVAIVVLGDTKRNQGQRAIAEKLAQIAVLAAAATIAALEIPT